MCCRWRAAATRRKPITISSGSRSAKEVLDSAFYEVYALHLKDVIAVESLAFGSYRHSVSSLIPEATKIAWKLKEKDIVADQPGVTRRKFLYNLSRSSYEKEWNHDYRKPGIFARVHGCGAPRHSEGRSLEGGRIQAAYAANRAHVRAEFQSDPGFLPQPDPTHVRDWPPAAHRFEPGYGSDP